MKCNVIGFINCFVKTLLSWYLYIFLKKTVNFMCSCAFAQKSRILRITNIKKTKSQASESCQVDNTAIRSFAGSQ